MLRPPLFNGMKNMKKKIVSSVSAAAMLTAFIPSAAAEPVAIVGEYIQLGTYNGAPIIWRHVDTDEHDWLMISDKIITIKAFDGAGMTAAGSHPRYQARRSEGSNYWGDSNIRTWLQSGDERITWPDKNPPMEKAVVDGYNEYDAEPGFMRSFAADELGAIKPVKLKTIVAISDHEAGMSEIGSEVFTWKAEIEDVVQNYDNAYAEYNVETVFLPDVMTANMLYNKGSVLGDDYYIGEPTEECVQQSEYKSSKLSSDQKWSYWLRTPYTDTHERVVLDEGGVVRYVDANGVVSNNPAYLGNIGIRPAFYLDREAARFVSGSGTKDDPYIVKADNSISVFLNSTAIAFDQPPIIKDDRTLVPIRAIFEAMGYTVDWNGDMQTATAVNGDDKITVTIGSSEISFTTNGESGTYTCDVPAQIVSDRTLVPVRAISESAGCMVGWDGRTRTVSIIK